MLVTNPSKKKCIWASGYKPARIHDANPASPSNHPNVLFSFVITERFLGCSALHLVACCIGKPKIMTLQEGSRACQSQPGFSTRTSCTPMSRTHTLSLSLSCWKRIYIRNSRLRIRRDLTAFGRGLKNNPPKFPEHFTVGGISGKLVPKFCKNSQKEGGHENVNRAYFDRVAPFP
jgi:hypothetical protein